jgi:cytochrome c peroxidase
MHCPTPTAAALGALLLLVAAASTAAGPAPREDLPRTTALAALGRQIFFDQSLSASGRLSCATCHDPRYAYGPRPGAALGLGGPHLDQRGTRAVPSLRYLNAVPAFALSMHFVDGDTGPGGGFTWDGRAGSLRAQAAIPLLAANEMANADAPSVVAKLRHAGYAPAFRALFGSDAFDRPDRAFDAALAALEAFQQTAAEFFPFSSKYDLFLRGDVDLTEQEERGVAIFKDPKKGNCASCHTTVNRGGAPPSFTDFDYANVGAPRNTEIPANSDPHYYDLGLCGPLRSDLADRKDLCGMFRTPTLRNVALRDAFMHNGVLHDLRSVLKFYAERDTNPERWYPRKADGTIDKENDLPPELRGQLNVEVPFDRRPGDSPSLSDGEIDDLLAFLTTLTDGYAGPAKPEEAE